jgi:hypothetical protein
MTKTASGVGNGGIPEAIVRFRDFQSTSIKAGKKPETNSSYNGRYDLRSVFRV